MNIELSKLPDLAHEKNPDNVESYIEILEEYISKRADRVKNIALTSPYAGGKTTIINEYIKKQDNPKKAITISLVNLAKKSANTGNIETANAAQNSLVVDDEFHTKCWDSSFDLEQGILSQILYREKSENVSASKVRHSYHDKALTPLNYFIIITFTVLFFLSASNFNLSITNLIDKVLFNTKPIWPELNRWLGGAYLSCYFASFCAVLKLSIEKISSLKLRNFTFGNVEAEVADRSDKNESAFNTHMEEIIYFFKKSDTQVVFFEDIDRFDSPDIFLKLYELNKVLNDAEELKHKGGIQFVYAVKDNVFVGSDRTKLFQAIIPLVPIMSKTNAYEIIKQTMNKLDISGDFTSSFLKGISIYLPDIRVVKNIVNEYVIYKNTVFNNEASRSQKEILFSFMIYKNLQSHDFSLLSEDKGYLVHIFKNKALVISEIQKRLESEIKQLKIEEAALADLKDSQGLDEKYIKAYKEALAELEYKFDRNIHIIDSVQRNPITIEKIDKWNSDDSYNTAIGWYPSAPDKSIESDTTTLKEFLELNSNIFANRIHAIQQGYDQSLYSIRQKIEAKTIELRHVGYASIRSLIKRYKSDVDSHLYHGLNKMDYPLLDRLLAQGKLVDSYELYIHKQEDGELNVQQKSFIKDVHARKKLNPIIKIEQIEKTLSYFEHEDIVSESFVNYQLVNHIVKMKDHVRLELMIQGIIEREMFGEILQWYKNITLKLEFSKLIHKITYLFIDSYLSNQYLSIRNKIEFFENIVIGKSSLTDSELTSIKETFESNSEIANLALTDNIIKILKQANLRFSSIDNIKPSNIDVLVTHKLWEVNLENLVILTKLNGIEMNRKLIFSDILSLCDIYGDSFTSIFFNEDNSNIILDELERRIEIVDDISWVEIFLSNWPMDKKIKIIETYEFKLKEVDEELPEEIIFKLYSNNHILFTNENFKKALGMKFTNEDLIKYLSYEDTYQSFKPFKLKLALRASEDYKDLRIKLREVILDSNIAIQPFSAYLIASGYYVPDNKVALLSNERVDKLIDINHLNPKEITCTELNEAAPELLAKFIFKNKKLLENPAIIATLSKDQVITLLEYKLSQDEKITIIETTLGELQLDFDQMTYNSIKAFISKYSYKDRKFIPARMDIGMPMLKAVLQSKISEEDKVQTILAQADYIESHELQPLFAYLKGKYGDLATCNTFRMLLNNNLNNDLVLYFSELGLLVPPKTVDGEKIRFKWKA